MRTAACSCGQLVARCEGEPVRVSMCHCLACQRRTGSPFAVQARWPVERVAIAGAASEYTLPGDEGPGATFRFCATCGATVYFTNAALPGMIAVPVGAFAEPAFPPPATSIYGERKHAWIAIAPGYAIEEHD